MSKIINFNTQSREEAELAGEFWTQKIKDQILGKTITFTGMMWETKRHRWESYTVKVTKVYPNVSGDPFSSEVEFLGDDGNSYTIHSDSDLTIVS